MRLKVKIAVIMAVVSVMISGFTTLSSTNVMQVAMDNRLEEEGRFIASTLKETLLARVLQGESQAVRGAINEVVKNNQHIEYVFIVDFDNRLFAHSLDQDLPVSLVSSVNPIKLQQYITENSSNPGGIVQVSEFFVEALNARLYVGMNDAQTQAYVHKLNRHILNISFVVLLLTVILGVIFSHHISAPLIRLTQKMASYGQGKAVDFEELSTRWIDSEVKDLNAAFKNMVIDIQEGMTRLQDSKASLARAQKIANLGNWDWNIAEDSLFWSDEIYRIFGLKSNEFAADYDAFLQTIHPDDRDKVVNAVEAALKDSQIPYFLEHRIVLPDGEVRIVHEQAEIFRDALGRPLRMIGTVQDITERKKNEQELHRYRYHLEELVEERTREVKRQARIIDQIHDAVVIMDLKGKVTFWNRGAEKLFLYDTLAILGNSIDVLSPNKTALFVEQFVSHFSKTGEHELETKLRRRDNVLLDVYMSLSMISDDQDTPVSILGYFIDISERKRAEIELKKRTNELSVVNKELEAFSYSVSHDLRTPLRAIDGFSLALLEDYSALLDDQGKDYLQRVRKGAQHMAQLIDDLLMLSRVTRNSLKLGFVNLSLLAEEIVNELLVGEPRSGVDIKIAPNVVAKGDASLIRLVFQNLIGNAWKFTRPKEKTCIEFGVTTDDSSEPIYYVRDNGVGFSMQYADKLFGAFQRLHRAEQFEGTGIGLATVQRIIHRHGGQVWAKSEEDNGASFFFTLGLGQKNTLISIKSGGVLPDDDQPLQPLLGADNA